MSWNDCLYEYHKKHAGQFLAGRDSDDGLLLLTWMEKPLVVDISMEDGGRYGPYPHVRARTPVTLSKPYKLTVGAEKVLSGGVNNLLKVVPDIAGYSADFGYPEVTKKRLIRTENVPFTKLVLGSLELRNALLACPGEKLKIQPGPGAEGVHLITVTTAAALSSLQDGGDGGGWYLGTSGEYTTIYGSEEDKAKEARRVEEEFFPRMDRFLDLCRAAYSAVTQWPL